MLPKAHRLPLQEFLARRRLTRGVDIRSRWLRIQILSNDTDSTRFGVLIGKKFDKRATRRNRVRRALVRRFREGYPWREIHKDVCVAVDPSAREAHLDELIVDFDAALRNALDAHGANPTHS